MNYKLLYIIKQKSNTNLFWCLLDKCNFIIGCKVLACMAESFLCCIIKLDIGLPIFSKTCLDVVTLFVLCDLLQRPKTYIKNRMNYIIKPKTLCFFIQVIV